MLIVTEYAALSETNWSHAQKVLQKWYLSLIINI